MTHIAYFEPSYTAHDQRDWEIRGSYKYPSLLTALGGDAAVSIVMRTLPPESDPHRQRLERDFGVRFIAVDTTDNAGVHVADMLAEDYGAAIAELAPDIVSTLNGRMIGHNFALARAAHDAGVDYVYRIAGNDLATQTAVFAEQGRPFEGSAHWASLVAQERYAAEAARNLIVMGGTEHERAAALVSDPGKIAICRRGVDQTHFLSSETPPERCTNILFLGRNSAEKGIHLIEAAAANLAATHPDIRFTIAGDFAERDEGNRRYRGFYSYAALPKLYRDHHALLLPASSEGFPQVVMEAMSCGLPAILPASLFSADFGSDDGVALIERKADAIEAAIVEWHDNPGRYAADRERALAHARANFDEKLNGVHYRRVLLGDRDD